MQKPNTFIIIVHFITEDKDNLLSYLDKTSKQTKQEGQQQHNNIQQKIHSLRKVSETTHNGTDSEKITNMSQKKTKVLK